METHDDVHSGKRTIRGNLLEKYRGRRLQDVRPPAAVVDRAIVERNCAQMLDVCSSLEVDFRAHVKTHKTVEVTKLQVGEASSKIQLVVSTLAEIRHLLPFLISSKDSGKTISIIYGLPLPPSSLPEFIALSRQLGPQSLYALIDHPAHLASAAHFQQETGHPLPVFLKIDTGYHRAGLVPSSTELQNLLRAVVQSEQTEHVSLAGLYSHGGHSYDVEEWTSALEILIDELEGLEQVAEKAAELREEAGQPPLILSVGASPSIRSLYSAVETKKRLVQRLQTQIEGNATDFAAREEERLSTSRALALISRLKQKYTIELHAGVHAFLDMQQLVMQAGPSSSSLSTAAGTDDIALTILAEVASLYPQRKPPQVLVAAGTLALGREPCHGTSSWGILSPWGFAECESEGRSGWEVSKVSQEHGLLSNTSRDGKGSEMAFEIGQKVRIWPNHACIASAGYDWYLVVDSTLHGEEDKVIDVWVRHRGW